MSVICLAACAIAVLFSLGLLIRKVRTPVSVAVAFLLFGLAVSLGSAADRYRVDPGLDLAPVPLLSALALTGLMTFRLSGSLTRLETERRRHGLVQLLLLVPALLLDIVHHGFRARGGRSPVWQAVLPGLHVLVALLVIGLCVAALVRVFRLYRPRTMTGIAWVVLGISASGVVALCIGLAGMFSGDAHLYAVMDGFVSITVAAGALAFFRRPDVLDRFHEETVKQRYARSLLAGEDVEGLIHGMTEMVRSTALYRSDACRLDELSRRMGLSRHQVSELLNDRMGVSYSSFINGFRIDAARELLGSRPDMTILAVALEVGFGNKTSFNDAFRRQVGITPSEYRRRQAGAESASG